MSQQLYLQLQQLQRDVDALGKIVERVVARQRRMENNFRKPPQVNIPSRVPRPRSLKTLGVGEDPV